MPYIKNIKTVFVHIPKCAGTSIEKWLKDFQTLYLCDEKIKEFRIEKGTCSCLHGKAMHFTFSDILTNIPENKSELYAFTIVRNPYLRILSHYLFMKRNFGGIHKGMFHWESAYHEKDFESYIEKIINSENYCKILS